VFSVASHEVPSGFDGLREFGARKGAVPVEIINAKAAVRSKEREDHLRRRSIRRCCATVFEDH
jgi:hypothetical protein